MAPELAENRRGRERAERWAPVGIEALDRLQQSDGRDLDEVLVGDSAVAVAVREMVGNAEVLFDEIVAEGAIPSALVREEVGIAVSSIHGRGTYPVGAGLTPPM